MKILRRHYISVSKLIEKIYIFNDMDLIRLVKIYLCKFKLHEETFMKLLTSY